MQGAIRPARRPGIVRKPTPPFLRENLKKRCNPQSLTADTSYTYAHPSGCRTGLQDLGAIHDVLVAGFARIQVDFRSRAEFLRIQLQTCSCAHPSDRSI